MALSGFDLAMILAISGAASVLYYHLVRLYRTEESDEMRRVRKTVGNIILVLAIAISMIGVLLWI